MQANQPDAGVRRAEQLAELFKLDAQHRQVGVLAAVQGNAFTRRQHHAALPQQLAHALVDQLGGRHAPAGLRIRAQFLRIGIGQAVQHGLVFNRTAGGRNVGDGHRRQGLRHWRCRCRARGRHARAKVVHTGAGRFVDGRAAGQQPGHGYQAKNSTSARLAGVCSY